MDELIKLKPASEIGAGLGRGELAIDEATGELWVDLGAGAVAIPLDVGALAKPPVDVDPNAVAVFGDDGPTWTVLDAGAGGRPLDNATWIAPGALIVGAGELEVPSSFEADFEITEPVVVIGARAGASVAAVDYRFGITTLADVELIAFDDNASAGPAERTVADVTLYPGRYRFFITVDAPITFTTLQGVLPWSAEITDFPILLSFA